MTKPHSDESFCRRIAGIMGESSAAAEALRELEALRKEGKTAWVKYELRTWFVVSGCKVAGYPDPKAQPKN